MLTDKYHVLLSRSQTTLKFNPYIYVYRQISGAIVAISNYFEIQSLYLHVCL